MTDNRCLAESPWSVNRSGSKAIASGETAGTGLSPVQKFPFAKAIKSTMHRLKWLVGLINLIERVRGISYTDQDSVDCHWQASQDEPTVWLMH